MENGIIVVQTVIGLSTFFFSGFPTLDKLDVGVERFEGEVKLCNVGVDAKEIAENLG
jgi:hypothetical protein